MTLRRGCDQSDVRNNTSDDGFSRVPLMLPVRRCMNSVRRWSQLFGYEYSIIGDEEFLNVGPRWYLA